MDNKTGFAILNTVAFSVVIVVNILANALPLNGLNTGEVSDRYPNLFTPAGFTFSIWSMIYLGIAVFLVRQQSLFQRNEFKRLSLWFVLSCVLNASWIFAWHYLQTGLSVVIMISLLITLVQTFRIVHTIHGSVRHKWLITLPFSLYLSWICVATIANISAALIFSGWDGSPFTETAWTILVMGVAGVIATWISHRFNNPFFLPMTIWAFIGIAAKNLPAITPAAIGLIVVLLFFEIRIATRGKSAA